MYSYSYTYYDDGKLATEKHIVAGATEQPVIKYTYDNNGNVVSKVLSNSSNENDVKVTSSYSYNLANECVTEVHNNGTGYNYEYRYAYNPDGNVLESSLIKREKKIKTIYTYDRLNRLTSKEQQEYNKGDLSDEFKDVYSFDDYNNILQKVHTEDDTTKNSTVVSTYDKTRLLTQTETDSENNQSSQITYTYDDNGNMSSKVLVKGEDTTETQFTYDGFDRTTGIKIGDVTTSFDYNTDSDRVSKTTNGKTTESILDNGSISADLIGETLKVFSDDNSVFYQNGVFSYNVINTKGDIIASDGSNGIDYNYNAYGTELYKYSSANPIGYRNYYYDSETGLYYLKARYYDPTTGQFTQEDTVQDDNLQYNLYGYCSANPVLYTDPSGHYKGLSYDRAFGMYERKKTRYLSVNFAVDFKIYLDYNGVEFIKVNKVQLKFSEKNRTSFKKCTVTIGQTGVVLGNQNHDYYCVSYNVKRKNSRELNIVRNFSAPSYWKPVTRTCKHVVGANVFIHYNVNGKRIKDPFHLTCNDTK